MSGKLIILGLSIGNIEDLSIRSIKTLFTENNFYAEDTREFLKLRSIVKDRFKEILNILTLDSNKTFNLKSYRDQNHARVIDEIVAVLSRGENIVLTSDSGMPLISDPGYLLVRDILNRGFNVDVIPGPTALASALVISGLKTDKFVFLGFLPRTASKIKKIIEDYINFEGSIIVYESPYRVVKTLEAIAEISTNFEVAAIAEITKKFQKNIHGNINSVIQDLKKQKELKGEWVLILEPNNY